MKNFKITSCIILIICTIFTSCSNTEINDLSSNNLVNSETDSNFKEIYGGSFYEDGFQEFGFDTRYNNIKEKYSDKTILVWAVDFGMRYEDDLNEYLAEHNSDYVICFKDYSFHDRPIKESDSTDEKTYCEQIKTDLDNNLQIDIISTGGPYEYSCNYYKDLISKNWLEPFDEYLNNTEEGKTLYKLMPEKYWQSLKYNGKIYGFDGTISCINPSVGYVLNSEICDKLKINLNNFKGTYPDSIKNIVEICKKNQLKFTTYYLDNPKMFVDYDMINSFLYINKDGKVANIYENEEISKIFKAIENARINDIMMPKDVYWSENNFGEFIYDNIGSYQIDGVKTNDFYGVKLDNHKCVAGYTVFPVKSEIIHAATNGTGICSFSKEKDLAFKALAEIFSDQKLGNILTYGKDYEIKDGYVDSKGLYYTDNIDNRLLRVPYEGYHSKDMNTKIENALKNASVSPYCDFYFDTIKLSDKLKIIEGIIFEITTEFPKAENKSAEECLKQLNKKLYDAGLQDVIDEANRQLDEFYKDKSSN